MHSTLKQLGDRLRWSMSSTEMSIACEACIKERAKVEVAKLRGEEPELGAYDAEAEGWGRVG
jgi:hypothetical protein